MLPIARGLAGGRGEHQFSLERRLLIAVAGARVGFLSRL